MMNSLIEGITYPEKNIGYKTRLQHIVANKINLFLSSTSVKHGNVRQFIEFANSQKQIPKRILKLIAIFGLYAPNQCQSSKPW